MKNSKIISLASMITAFCVVFLALGAYIEMFDLSCLFIASVFLMIPLAKKSIKCAILTYFASSILSLIFTASTGRFVVTILFALFFGLHPIVNYIEINKKWNYFLLTFLKGIWFILTLFLMYYSFKMFTDIPDFIENYIIYIIVFGGFVFFIFYDYIMKRFQKITNKIIIKFNV